MDTKGVPFRESLNRPPLIMGCERQWVIGIGMLCFGIAMVGASIGTAIFAIVTWFSSLAALKRMGKADPMMTQVYVRHIRYKMFYSAKSHCHRNWRK